jgi:hypothetical protein
MFKLSLYRKLEMENNGFFWLNEYYSMTDEYLQVIDEY